MMNFCHRYYKTCGKPWKQCDNVCHWIRIPSEIGHSSLSVAIDKIALLNRLKEELENSSFLSTQNLHLRSPSRRLADHNEELKFELENVSQVLAAKNDVVRTLQTENIILKKQISQLSEENEAVKIKFQELRTLLEDQAQKVLEENGRQEKKLKDNIKELGTQVSDLQKELSELENSKFLLQVEFEDSRLSFEKELALNKENIQELTQNLSIENQNKKELEKLTQIKSEENLKLKSEIDKWSQIEYSRPLNKEVPYTTIHTNSLFSLNNKDGWQVKCHKSDQIVALQKKQLVTISFLGITGSGKSWVASYLSNGQLSHGWQDCPNSISMHYVTISNGWLGFLESSGKQEPIRANNKNIASSLADVPNNQLNQILADDSRILEHLKLSYTLKHSGVIVLVVGRFTQADLEYIQEINDLLKQDCGPVEEGIEWKHQPQLIIVHNLSWLKSISHVKSEIMKTLMPTFTFEEQPLFNYTSANSHSEKTHSKLFKDDFGLTHLIMAAEGSEAGEFYNPGTKEFLHLKASTLENKQKLPFCESFAEFCNQKLKTDMECDFGLKYEGSHIESCKIIATNKSIKISPLDLFHWSPSNHVGNNGTSFNPKYSTKIENSGDGMNVKVDIEMTESMIQKKTLKSNKGKYYLMVTGVKKEVFSEEDRKRKEGLQLFNKGREEGAFTIAIPLVKNSQFYDKEKGLHEEILGSGIIRYEMNFKKEEETSL